MRRFGFKFMFGNSGVGVSLSLMLIETAGANEKQNHFSPQCLGSNGCFFCVIKHLCVSNHT